MANQYLLRLVNGGGESSKGAMVPDPNVDFLNRLLPEGVLHLLAKLESHVLPTAMNRQPIDSAIMTGK